MSQNIPCGESSSRRGFSSFEDYKRRKGIADGLPEDRKMDMLIKLFECFTAAAKAASDNLQPGEFERRKEKDPALMNPSLSGSCMEALLETTAHSLNLMHACRDEMAAIPLSRVNGTSVAFASCVNACAEAEGRFLLALETAERHGLTHDLSEKVEQVKLKISNALTRMAVAFLLVPEWLHSQAMNPL